ncbi:hypothetical protein RvY_06039 [Ramazzottius varieornatus]|uniref:Uncharacterized protein n=1 Tax=Ramazzottius varieornatus TaxID=947166 RepID=A0A1D1V2N6_RAMVA|nr:hypothetical protein RvY_06039 [Ramazzottius varieornatus]
MHWYTTVTSPSSVRCGDRYLDTTEADFLGRLFARFAEMRAPKCQRCLDCMHPSEPADDEDLNE